MYILKRLVLTYCVLGIATVVGAMLFGHDVPTDPILLLAGIIFWPWVFYSQFIASPIIFL